MGLVGLEPTTSRLKARYSAIELQTHKRFRLSRFGLGGSEKSVSLDHETNISEVGGFGNGLVASWQAVHSGICAKEKRGEVF